MDGINTNNPVVQEWSLFLNGLSSTALSARCETGKRRMAAQRLARAFVRVENLSSKQVELKPLLSAFKSRFECEAEQAGNKYAVSILNRIVCWRESQEAIAQANKLGHEALTHCPWKKQKPNPEQAAKHFTVSAKLGDVEGQSWVGQLYLDGRAGRLPNGWRNYPMGAYWTCKAAQKGPRHAEHAWGRLEQARKQPMPQAMRAEMEKVIAEHFPKKDLEFILRKAACKRKASFTKGEPLPKRVKK